MTDWNEIKYEHAFKYWDEKDKRIIGSSTNPRTRFLLDAIKKGINIRIKHIKYRGEETERWVTPKQVFQVDDEDYLDAYCHLRKERRIFMVARLWIIYDRD